MKQLLRHILMEVLILCARLTEKVRQPCIPIFVYHSIDHSGTSIAISPEQFEQQLAYLQKKGYQCISASQALDNQRKEAPTKSVVLTFDDAYTNIAPWIETLLSQGHTATIFVPTAVLGGTNCWDLQKEGIVQTQIMTATQLQTLASKGCEMGAHTQNHPNLTEIPVEELITQLRDTRQDLLQTLDISTQIIAYPYGAHNDTVLSETQKAGYKAGFTTQLGYLTHHTHPLAIPRFPTNIDIQLFRLIVHGKYGWYRKLQDWVFG